MAGVLRSVVVLAGVMAAAGCGRRAIGPTAPSSAAATPPIRGVVRETNGGPIEGASIRLSTAWNKKGSGVLSDEAGLFRLPSSPDVCPALSPPVFEAAKAGYYFSLQERGPACTSEPNPPEVAVEIKAQRVLEAVDGIPVQATLTNDDLDWSNLQDPDSYPCGPCKRINLRLPPAGPVIIRVDWSGPDSLRLWLQGINDDYETVRLAELAPKPGERTLTLVIPVEWRQSYPAMLKVGLPYGSRAQGGLSAPSTLRIDLRSLAQ